MKKIILVSLVILLLSACASKPTQPTRFPGGAGQVTIIAPEPIRSFTGCAVKVDHPGNLVPEENGQDVVFTAPSEDGVTAAVTVRRRQKGEDNALPQDIMRSLIERQGVKNLQPAVGAFNVRDSGGAVLGGVQTDFVKERLHYRLIVIIRPNTKLPDSLSADAVYEVIATSPESTWYVWSELYKGYFNSFQPKDCE